MSSFDHHCAAAAPIDGLGCFFHVCNGGYLPARQDLGLGQVRGDHRSQRKKKSNQGFPGLRLQQGITALGGHHRVHHEPTQAVLLDFFRDGLDDFAVGKHSRLSGGHVQVA